MAHLPTSVPANFSTAVMYGEQNNTNNTACPPAELKELHITVLQVYILLITVLGIVLNVFVLMVFCLHKKACTMAEIYLSNMAAADLLLMAFLPFWAEYVAKKYDWTFGTPLCRLVTLSINMNSYCSIYFLVLISIDRYMALVHPLSNEGMRRPKYAKLGCLLVWCFGLLLSVPSLVYREVIDSPNSKSECYLNYRTPTEDCLFTVMQATFGFIIPISIISFCTFRIIRALNNRLIVGLNTKQVEQKATTLVLAVLLAFMICWVPLHLVKIVVLFLRAGVLTESCTIVTIIYTCANIFMYFAFFNSVLNPILYVIVGKNFRKKVRELFKQWSINRATTLSTTSTRSKMSRSVKTEVVSSFLRS